MGNAGGKEAGVTEGEGKGAALTSIGPPPVVKLGDPKRKWEEHPLPSIRLEDVVPPEERVQPPSADDSSSRSNLWQVYALGTFLIAQWAWGRWNERKDKDSNDPSAGGD